MNQKWQPQGIIIDGWAQCPTVLEFHDFWRIYYSNRDEQNRSFICFVDVEINNPKKIINKHPGPLLQLGGPGCFDFNGTMATSVLKHNSQVFLYYIGWSKRADVPFNNYIGLAVSDEKGANFTKVGPGPIIGLNKEDPFFCGTFNVLREYSRGWVFFRGYYLSCTDWVEIDGKLEPKYLIKYTESSDGINWSPGRLCINYKHANEAIANASVLKTDKDDYQMWYCFRNVSNYKNDKEKSYKIGYAESSLARGPWTRKDELVNLNLDSLMLAYPNVIKSGQKLFMFYNTDFGKSGISYATFEIPTD